MPSNIHGQATPFGAFNSGLRDIIELSYRCPDKTVTRIAHGSLKPGWGGGGDEFLFKFLKDFRGQLVHTACADLDVWPVAALHSNQLVLVVFNDHKAEREIKLELTAPAGMTLQAGRKVWVQAKEDPSALEFREEPVPAAGARVATTLKLPQQSGVKLVFPLQGVAPVKPEVTRRQFFAKGVLNRVSAERPVTLHVPVDPVVLARSETAWLKLVLAGVRGEATVLVNGTPIQLPAHEWITEVPVPVKLLKPDTTLRFETKSAGYQLDIASVLLEQISPVAQ